MFAYQRKCLELERNLISNPGPDKTSLSKQILNEIDNSSNVFEKEEVIKVSLQKCIADRNLTFHSWLQELKEIRKLKVDEFKLMIGF